MRNKSSLTGKKFWKKDCFANSRRSCERFAEGNKLASKVYKQQDELKRKYSLFCQLKSMAILLLKDETPKEEVLISLQEFCDSYDAIPLPNKKIKRKKNPLPYGKHICDGYVIMTPGRLMQYLNLHGQEVLGKAVRAYFSKIPVVELPGDVYLFQRA